MEDEEEDEEAREIRGRSGEGMAMRTTISRVVGSRWLVDSGYGSVVVLGCETSAMDVGWNMSMGSATLQDDSHSTPLPSPR